MSLNDRRLSAVSDPATNEAFSALSAHVPVSAEEHEEHIRIFQAAGKEIFDQAIFAAGMEGDPHARNVIRHIEALVPDLYELEDEEGAPPISLNPLIPQSQSEWEEDQAYLNPLNTLISQTPDDDWPVMADAAFHGITGRIVGAIDPHTEADPVAILLTILTAAGGAIGRGPHAQADGSQHPARLFTVLVGDTSKARKGTSWAQAKRVFEYADETFTKDQILGGFGSGEALVDAVGEARENRVLVIEPEWARLLAVGRREGSTLSPLIRQAWDGDRLAIRSRGAGTVTADNAHVVVLGHVTAEELRMKLTDVEIANGFANRHLFALVKRSKLLPSGGNLDVNVLQGLGHQLRRSLEEAQRLTLIKRTDAAEKQWHRLYVKLADDEPGGLVGSIIARDSAQVLRLSVIYALLDGSEVIDVEHLTAASAVWDYCRESARIIFGDSLGNPTADALFVAIRSAGPAGLSATQQNKAMGGHASKNELNAARTYLEKKGLIVFHVEKTDGAPMTLAIAKEHAKQAEKAEKAEGEF
jgi:hypothetical protein